MSSKKPAEDLQPTGFPDLDWSLSKRIESLDKLRGYTESEAAKANRWYLKKRQSMRFLGRTLRLLAILMAGGAGLVPIISQLWQADGKPLLAPGWSPLLLGLAGICIFLDRFLGGTSSWLRFVRASQEIGDLARVFRFDWEMYRAALGTQTPGDDQTLEGISTCRKLLADVDRIVRDETEAWAEEFRSVLKQVDETAAAAAKTQPTGGIDVEVTNGDQATGGWSLRIDDGTAIPQTGKTASVTGLLPALHKISASGTIGGAPKRAEKTVNVRAGAVELVTLTLA
jgi:hypothetical protein